MSKQKGKIGINYNEDEDMEWGVGKVNKELEELSEKLKKLEEERGYSGRTVEDEELNEMWKNKQLWEDPLANYFQKKQSKKRKKNKKEYKGHWPPNRFNIPPGYKWDGVDRSNGFEKRLLDLVHLAKEDKKKEEHVDYDMDL